MFFLANILGGGFRPTSFEYRTKLDHELSKIVEMSDGASISQLVWRRLFILIVS
ncbi:uncharacterized protein PHALS_05822 [Plasmopara halstedii]|uniref:Uncharacterized protein n=1 Tax=Plasmopara halstedii TaxID=4781 RepID=A0A0P1ABT3_PLAHL|nr:uncharacterized protein PHALS_05822 [Plasmopara halstedii]CEG37767.1 hypothetical protein PHALS_05822 [Plasmopara halstedii]|eukprot:XP_024574136.1 hypothetical protein PHALS_05822 [Plasmopara halstedii]